MRSALSVFRTAIPKKATKNFSNEMRWAAKALDRARDLDVYITENLAVNEKGQQSKLRRIAEENRKRAYKQVASLVKSKRYSKLCEEFKEWIDARAWQDKLSEGEKHKLHENIVHFASEVLEEHRSKILEYGKDIEYLDSELLHRMRIECKKLRYATEFFFFAALWRSDEGIHEPPEKPAKPSWDTTRYSSDDRITAGFTEEYQKQEAD